MTPTPISQFGKELIEEILAAKFSIKEIYNE